MRDVSGCPWMIRVVSLMMHLELTEALAAHLSFGSQPSRGLSKGGGNQRPAVRLVEQLPTSTIHAVVLPIAGPACTSISRQNGFLSRAAAVIRASPAPGRLRCGQILAKGGGIQTVAAYFEPGSNFQTTRRGTTTLPDGLHYRDNTNFIRALENCGSNRCLFVRPPRFGKSLTMDMLACYYDEQVQGDEYDGLFKGLAIHKNETAGRGKFQVLELTLDTEETPAALARVINRQALNFAAKYRYSYAGTAPEVRKTWAEVEEVRLSYELQGAQERRKEALRELKEAEARAAEARQVEARAAEAKEAEALLHELSDTSYLNFRKRARLKKALSKLPTENDEAETFGFYEEVGVVRERLKMALSKLLAEETEMKRLKKALSKLAADREEADCFTFDEEDGLKTLESLAEAVKRRGEKMKQKGEHVTQLYLFIDEYDNFVYQRLTPEKKGEPKEDAAAIKSDRNSVASLLNKLKTMEREGLVNRYLITGLSRNKIGRQSRANSIRCISNVPALADACGFTRDDANRSLACIEPPLTPSEQEQALLLMTDCFNGYRFHISSSGVLNSQLCMSFLNKLCLENGDGEGRNNRCWLDPKSPEFWVTMKEDNGKMYKNFVSTVGDDQCIPNGDILNMLVASDVGFEQLKRLIRSAVKQDEEEARAKRGRSRGPMRVVDEFLRGDFDPIPFSESELGERYDVSSLLTGPTHSVVNNYMYDMGIGTLAEDGLSLQVPNKFVLSLLLNQLEPLSESTKRSRLIQNAEDAASRSKALLDFFKEVSGLLRGSAND